MNEDTPIRLLILGPPASGKTLLARKWAEALDVPHIEADQYFWKNPKRKTLGAKPQAEFESGLSVALSAHSSWILEGLGKYTVPLCKEQVTHWIWLDCGKARRLPRLLWRSLKDPNALKEMTMPTPKPTSFSRFFDDSHAKRIYNFSELLNRQE